MSFLSLFVPPFVACLVLTAILAYLGIHVVSRGVIFVDIALAQVSALGITFALLAGFPPESQTAYLIGLSFTVLAAIFFAFFRHERLPQEAIIGVSFAVSSALAVLIADRVPHGSEHLKFILSGNILWVRWPQILKASLVCLTLGLFHYLLRDRFLLVSTSPEEARRRGFRLWFWDLLFYLSFGFVITSAVQMAGVLLVFSFLIVPALCGMLFCDRLMARLLVGWTTGVLTSLIGIAASFRWDLPTGPAIVTAFGVTLAASLLGRRFARGRK